MNMRLHTQIFAKSSVAELFGQKSESVSRAKLSWIVVAIVFSFGLLYLPQIAYSQATGFSKQGSAKPTAKASTAKKESPKDGAAVVANPVQQASGAVSPSGRIPKSDWITSADAIPGKTTREFVYFRKKIQFSVLEQAQLQITASDSYEAYINGRRVGLGAQTDKLDTIDISNYCKPGDNTIAIRAQNHVGDSARLLCRLYVKPRDEGWRGMGTSTTWLANSTVKAGWQLPQYDDSAWNAAKLFSTSPNIPSAMELELTEIEKSKTQTQTVATKARITDNRVNEVDQQVASDEVSAPKEEAKSESSSRFSTEKGFSVELVVDQDVTGSLVAMAFNEFGHIIASREGGPLLLIYDADKDGKPEKVRTYSDKVTNIQGILPLNGDVFVTGDGGEGSGLYRLIDQNRDGTLEEAKLLVRFKGVPGEHGAHQIALGPDGMIYVIVGNHVQVDGPVDSSSSYRRIYEGDLVQPRQEDPSGHAQGIKAPGGTLVRVDLTGERVQIVAGGFRNAYDLAFHPRGNLYIHDSDMEADIGTTWHRSTSLFQIIEGGEYGWRSGWANQPNYLIDRLPAMLSTGRSSPTGAVVYDHNVYPTRYQQNLYLADWSEGRILRFDTKPNADGGVNEPIPFVTGRPMNVTDIDVGPDGSLYFCTGGRGTAGGIYAVRYTEETNKETPNLGDGIAKAIRQPQLQSAWGRQSVAMIKRELGDSWDELIAGVAYSPDNPARYRIRALDLMQLLGPVPSTDLLIDLSRSPNEALRIKTSSLLALHAEDKLAMKRLIEMMGDSSNLVKLASCEALIRADQQCTPEALKPLLQSSIRNLGFVARRLLEQMPTSTRDEFLNLSGETRLTIQTALASIMAEPNRNTALKLIPHLTTVADGFVSDQDFVDLLRTYELVLALGQLRAEDVPALASMVVKEFPAGEPRINRHLIRLATHLQCTEIVEPVLTYVKSKAPMEDRVDAALYVRLIPHQWTAAQRTELLQFFEQAQRAEGGSSYSLYIMNATREFAESMTTDEAISWVAEAKSSPNAALAAIPRLPESLTPELFRTITSIDKQIDQGGFENDVFKRLKTGFTAALARSGDDASMTYLREVWRRSPDRRPTIALALAQKPEGENWDYIVRSLGVIESFAASEVMTQLVNVPVATEDAQALRSVILMGLRLAKEGQSPKAAIGLLEHWTGESMTQNGSNSTEQLAQWQDWYRGKFPEQSDPILPEDSGNPQWSLEFIEQYLEGDSGRDGSPQAGLVAFNKVQCASCHRFRDTGVAIGPDLTSLTRRFTLRETLESVLYPSHTISDQYLSKKILTRDGNVVTGITVNTKAGVTVRTSDRKQVVIAKDDIEEMEISKESIMPSGLLDQLSPIEIRDLLCYLGYVPAKSEMMANGKSDTIRR